MTPQRFLQVCADLEQLLAELYRDFAVCLAEHPQATSLFRELSEQEAMHARSLQFTGRLLRGVTGVTTIDARAEKVAGAMHGGLQKAREILRGGKKLGVEEALQLAIRIESCALEAHGSDFIQTDNEELRNTLRMLVCDTDQHKARLEALLEEVQAVSLDAGPGE